MKFGLQVGLGPGHFVLDGDAALHPQKGHSPIIFGPCPLAKWLDGLRCYLVWRYSLAQATGVRWGAASPSPQKEAEPRSLFLADIYCGQMAEWINMPLGTEVGLGPGDIVLDGDPAPFQKGHSPQFLAHVRCGQTAGWIKMPLGMEVDLCSGDVVLDGTELPLQKRAETPNFRPMSIVAKWLDASVYHLVRR